MAQDLRERVLEAGGSTRTRLLVPWCAAAGSHDPCGTRLGASLWQRIRRRPEQSDLAGRGYIKADTVTHCRESMAGEFCWNLTATDAYTKWAEARAVSSVLRAWAAASSCRAGGIGKAMC